MVKSLKAFCLLLSVCVCFVTYGKSVDENTAKTIGSHFLVSVGVSGVKTEANLTTAYIATASIGGSIINDYYVFNIIGGNGFVMVSGDDIVIPILAYSNEGAFDINNTNPNAQSWDEGYQNQITYVIQHNIPAQAGTSDSWNELKATPKMVGARTTSSGPLLTTTWDQAPNYNFLCPGLGTNKAVTGCVATAMAQVMKFWNWPTVGTGSHTYTSRTNSYNLTADFGNTVYNWANMPNSISNHNNAVDTLMLAAGISIDMDYTSTESGAWVISLESPGTLNCAEFALKTYFHYKPTLQGVPRSGEVGGIPAPITQTAWINMLEAEINAGRPVIYSGNSTTAGGHCWVCDGYNSANYMHFNWGWSGTGPNGYYSVNSIAPPALGIGGGGGNFNNDQCAIIGIQPENFPTSTTGNLKMQTHLDCPTNSAINYDGPFSIVTQILNSGTTAFSGDFCVQMFDASNNLAGTVQTITGQTIAAGGTSPSLTFSTTGIVQMVPGEYSMMVMSRTSSTSPWTAVANNGTFINYNMIDVANSQIVELYDSMHVGSHTIVRGSGMTINTKVANLGTYNFNGTLQAVLVNVATGTAYPVQQHTGQVIGSNYFASFSFTNSSITAPSGTYVLSIQHQPNGTGSYIITGSDLYQNPIIFNIISSAQVNGPSSIADNITVYPNPTKDIINIATQGVNVSEIWITDINGRQIQRLSEVNNQSVIQIPVSQYAPGIYFVNMQAGGELVTKKIIIN